MVYFTKPKDVSYTQMAMWVDENAYKEDCDDYLLFQYLYHIIGMIAFKRQFFNKNSLYTDYAVYGATVLFMRLKNEKQFKYDENGNPLLPQIKSILNYAKKKAYPLKVNFEQEHYSQVVVSDEHVGKFPTDASLYEPAHNDQYTSVDFVVYVRDIPKTIRQYLSQKPVAHMFGDFEDLYISVVLTFLNAVTLPSATITAIKGNENAIYRNPHVVDRLYRRETENPVILYNIHKRYRGLVMVLFREICELVAEDISNLYKTHQYGEAVVKNLLLESMFDSVGDIHV